MEKYIGVFTKMAFILLAVWVVLAGLGKTTMPGTRKQAMRRRAYKQPASGLVWNSGFVQAPSAEEGLAFPAAPVM